MKTRTFKQVGILVVAGLLVGTTVLAQGPFAPSGNPFATVFSKLDQIIDILTPATPEAGPVRLSTGAAVKRGVPGTRSIACDCVFVNLGTTTIPLVLIELKDAFGNTVVSSSNALPAGRTSSVGTFVDGVARCEFSFVGFADDGRGTLLISDATTSELLLALDAR